MESAQGLNLELGGMATQCNGKCQDGRYLQSDEAQSQLKSIFKVFHEICGDTGPELDQPKLFEFFHLLSPGAISSNDIADFFGQIDKDGNGSISFLEFVYYLYGLKEFVDNAIQRGGIMEPECHVLIGGEDRKGVLDNLHTWTQSSVTFLKKGRAKQFQVKSVVEAPRGTFRELEAWLELWVPALTDQCTMKNANCMLLVTGACECDRMNIMAGETPSIGQHDGIAKPGILPRSVETILKYMENRRNFGETLKMFLGASLLEFSDGTCYDLLCDCLPVSFDGDNMPQASFANITKVADLLPLIARVKKRKEFVGPKKVGCSHYAWHFRLYETWVDEFGDVRSPGEIAGRKISFVVVEVATTGSTEYELSIVEAEIPEAVEAHVNGKAYKPKLNFKNDFVRWLQGCLTGDFHPSVAVCLSQSMEDDSYNWPAFAFSQSMCRLKVNPRKQQIINYAKTLAAAKAKHAEEDEKLSKTDQSKDFWLVRKCLTKAVGQEAEIWEQLRLG